MERIHTHHSHSPELIIPKDRNTTYLVVEGNSLLQHRLQRWIHDAVQHALQLVLNVRENTHNDLGNVREASRSHTRADKR